MKKRKILFVTERRADYSRLKPIMRLVQKSKKLELQLIVIGQHLLASFGETWKDIERDGFRINATVAIFKDNDNDDGAVMASALGDCIQKLVPLVQELRPDLIFTGFDLGGHLAAAIVGMHMNIPVAHIQGGERSGTIDEVLRHAQTKFSHMHFVATKESRDRIIRLGEDKRYVFLVGSPSLDTIKHISYPKKEIIFKKFGLDPKVPLIVLSQHPVTTEVDRVERDIEETIEGVQSAAKKCGAQVLAIYSNNDAGGKRIVSRLRQSHFVVFPHIPYEDYLRLLKYAHVLVGNSSAGIHEAPSFGLPAVNIGSRQQLRERGKNMIDVPNERIKIETAVIEAISDASFRRRVKRGKNPYDNGDTAKKVVHILETIKLPPVQKVITY